MPRTRRFPYRPIRRRDVQTFTSGATGWTKPTGAPTTAMVHVAMVGGGGGGGGASTETITRGAGGAGGAGIVMVRYLACPACGRSS